MKKRVLLRLHTSILAVTATLLLPLAGIPAALLAKDQLSVTRDKDKTIYSIDSSERTRQEDLEERERAWDMLRHMPVIIDKRQNQTMPATPAQPAPSK